MIGATFCSGVGAPELAAPWVDWRLASDIEAFPREVLAARFGYTDARLSAPPGTALLWGDFTALRARHLRRLGVPLPDLVVAGTPCQAFSFAGARKGLDDARGNLTLAFVEMLHAFVAARPDGKLAAVWENVPGVLSDKTNAFGCFLGRLVGALDAICPPVGGGWSSEGMVAGPRARVAWAVLNAEFFGVAQRRRRLFAVIDFGGAVDPAAVLFEPDSLRGDPPARGEARAEAAGGAGGGAAGDCWPADVANTLDARFAKGPGLDDQHINANAPLFVPAVVGALTSNGVGACGADDNQAQAGHLIAMAHGQGGAEVFADGRAPTLTCNHEAPILAFDTAQITSPQNRANPRHGDPAPTLAARAPGRCIAFTANDAGQDAAEGVAPTLRAAGHRDSRANAGVAPAVAILEPGERTGVSTENPAMGLGVSEPGASMYTLQAGAVHGVGHEMGSCWAVRRLMPVECERLQGLPDGHTAITRATGRPATDGPRYKAVGNSMAVPVMRWILDRLRVSMAAHGVR